MCRRRGWGGLCAGGLCLYDDASPIPGGSTSAASSDRDAARVVRALREVNVVRLILVFAMASSSVACLGLGGKQAAVQAPVAPKSASDAPEWVMRTPRMPGNICATGAVDPTFFRQDGRTQAADSARNELARTIQVKVSSVMYDEQTTDRKSVV